MTSDPKTSLNENDPLQLFVKKCLNFLSTYKKYLIFSFITLFVLVAGSILYIQNQEKELQIAKKNLVRAEEKIKEKKYTESEKIYLSIIDTNLDQKISLRAKLGLSNLYKFQKEYSKSVEILKTTLKEEGITTVERELVYRSFISVYKITAKCESISELLDNNEFRMMKKDDLYLTLGRCYDKKGNSKKSFEAYKKLIQEYPKSPFLTNRIKTLSSNGKL